MTDVTIQSKKIVLNESESCSVVSNSLRPHGLYSPWDSPGKNPGVGRLSLLQGIFPTQGSNPGLQHCRQILYQLSHQESPVVKDNSPCHAGDTVSISGSERSPGGGTGKPLQYSCLGNPMNRGAWWAIVHGVTKSQTQLKCLSSSGIPGSGRYP